MIPQPIRSREITEASEFLLGTRCVSQTSIEKLTGIYHEVPGLYIKREDTQLVKSFKIRGALNAMSILDESQKRTGVVCASAGNHAQGIAVSCSYFGVHGTIFMPKNAPDVKIKATKEFGGDFVDIELVGNNFDETKLASNIFAAETGKTYIHPFDDTGVMIGAATIGYEIFNQMTDIGLKVDYIIAPIGGGGLISGIISAKNLFSPMTTIIGVEPSGLHLGKNPYKSDVYQLFQIQTHLNLLMVQL